jgi:hypothetical protein
VKALEEAEKTLDRWYGALESLPAEDAAQPGEAFMAALQDDLNTPGAIAELFTMIAENPAQARASARLLGLLQMTPAAWGALRQVDLAISSAQIEELIEARLAARAAKNWAESDRIRDELAAKGVALKDAKDPATGEMRTTISGLSEGIMWDAKNNTLAHELLAHYGIDENLICSRVPQFGEQGRITKEAADHLGLTEDTPVTYRAGDQPNNAFSLNVLQPGEIAATAGTSGVVYGVIDTPSYDPLSRVNSFVHVNHTKEKERYGVLLCINGTGILNSWLQKNVFTGMSYPEINKLASSAPIGSDGLLCYPFGNGAERVLENSDPGSMIKNLHFNRHNRAHLARAAQEGIVFSLFYGIEIMMKMGLHTLRQECRSISAERDAVGVRDTRWHKKL